MRSQSSIFIEESVASVHTHTHREVAKRMSRPIYVFLDDVEGGGPSFSQDGFGVPPDGFYPEVERLVQKKVHGGRFELTFSHTTARLDRIIKLYAWLSGVSDDFLRISDFIIKATQLRLKVLFEPSQDVDCEYE